MPYTSSPKTDGISSGHAYAVVTGFYSDYEVHLVFAREDLAPEVRSELVWEAELEADRTHAIIADLERAFHAD